MSKEESMCEPIVLDQCIDGVRRNPRIYQELRLDPGVGMLRIESAPGFDILRAPIEEQPAPLVIDD